MICTGLWAIAGVLLLGFGALVLLIAGPWITSDGERRSVDDGKS